VTVWRSSVDLGLTGNLTDEWNNYTIELNGARVTLHLDEEDSLLWTRGDKKGDLTAKNCYEAMLSLQELPVRRGWQQQFWKWHFPLKVKLFFWLAFHNRILTWDMLQKKGLAGLSHCCLCCQKAKDTHHLFIDCMFTKSVWTNYAHILNFNHLWDGPSLANCMDSWVKDFQISNSIMILLCWLIWNERNKCLFEGHIPSAWAVVLKFLGAFKLNLPDWTTQRVRQNSILRRDGYSLATFDGATLAGGTNCGAGETIKTTNSQVFWWYSIVELEQIQKPNC
jgi:hypothetical protein